MKTAGQFARAVSRHYILALVLGAASLTAIGANAETVYEWSLPRGFPQPAVPADNPMTEEKVALGRLLFYETRLSVTGEYSCASCHQQSRAFTDGRAKAQGATGQLHPRSAMSLANVAYAPALQWADPKLGSLEAQAPLPLLNEHPLEMGLKGREAQVLEKLANDAKTRAAFMRAFPDIAYPVTLINIARALASFERTLISGRSAFDRRVFDDDQQAMTESARRGMTLFYSQRTGCSGCHSGITFAGAVTHSGSSAEPLFANTGLYNVDGSGRYPASAAGLAEITHRERDHGRFRVPSLRNVAVTAPYMHDGSVATLGEVIDHYAAGGRQAPLGPTKRNRYRDTRLAAFQITPGERDDLLAFLESLTDTQFLTDPRFSDPRASQVVTGSP